MPMANQANDTDSVFVSAWPRGPVNDETQCIFYDHASSYGL